MSSATVMSPKELVAVKELRHRVNDLIPSLRNDYHRNDLHLMRFLRARNLNIDKAEEMLRKNMTWRRTNNVDTILSKVLPPEFETDYPLIMAGRDKTGDQVAVLKIGQFDIRKGVEAGLKKDFATFGIQSFEYATDICTSISTKEDFRFQTYIIADFEGWQFRQVASKDVLDVALELVRIFEANYPESLKAMRVINAPKIFTVLWSLIRPVLNERTISKISIYGSNKEQWKAKLREEVSPDNLPSEYGGAISNCPKAIYRHGTDGVFPKFETLPEEDLTTVLIEAGLTHEVHLDLPEGSQISWNFKTEKHDVGFRVQYDGLQDVLKYARVDSHIFLQKGNLVCDQPGKYTLIFDNSYSSFTSKTLRYAVRTYN